MVNRKYRCVIADPPWDIQQRGKNSRGAERHYDLMSLERIKAMPVADLCEENAHCWLWVTNAALEAGYEVLRAWGFTPRSIFCWIKPRLGLGVYLRNASEHVLLGTRGKAPIMYNAQPNWLFAPVQAPHSHKPEEFHKIVERCSPGPYLELFARRRQPGWDVWGNQIDSDVELEGYPVPLYSAACGKKPGKWFRFKSDVKIGAKAEEKPEKESKSDQKADKSDKKGVDCE